jgi:hypothetical protein
MAGPDWAIGQFLRMDRPVASFRPDRRHPANRPPDPPCPYCQSTRPRPTLRTTAVIYYRCEDCGETWCVDKYPFPGS